MNMSDFNFLLFLKSSNFFTVSITVFITKGNPFAIHGA